MPSRKESTKKPDRPADVQPADADAPVSGTGFPIVGMGASAGGLAALEAFLSAIPRDTATGIAYVFVQHLSPDHASILGELVKRNTSMQVCEVTDGLVVEPDKLYLIPPNRDMALINGTLQLLDPTVTRGVRLPIDFFFRSLAQDQRARAICVVLSGTGTDGTLGARAVKGEGGMVIAQDPESTEYDGMPSSVIATGVVDHILRPEEMPAQIFAYVQQLFSTQQRLPLYPPISADTLKKICLVVRAQTGHDFSGYKENTIARRIARRMALQQIGDMEQYLRYLQNSRDETESLFRDLLIGVTNFFRDSEAFAAFQQKAIPHLFENKEPGSTIRAWVCGCSTGEEAYSIALLCQEYMDAVERQYNVQIFATDIDDAAINLARTGLFPASIAVDVSSERLARHFMMESGNISYRVKKSIRDMVIFSKQDVIKDPPFSRVDLVSCRNLLIYMGTELQKMLIPLFHYSLNPNGILFLGTSESIGEYSTLFATLDRKWKIYMRRQDFSPVPRFTVPTMTARVVEPPGGSVMAKPGSSRQRPVDLRALTEHALLAHFGQAAVLVNAHGDIRFIHGRTGKYLEPAQGTASINLLNMAREGLRRELTTALHKAVTRNESVVQDNLRVRTNGDFVSARLTVQPLPLSGEPDEPQLYLIVLEEMPAASLPAREVPAQGAEQSADSTVDTRLVALERELAAKEEYLQSTLEEMETTNEELRSTNEELQSVNEELQSTNEELETSKEELQSVNEELATVNAELQAKVAELSRANNDMNNLLAGTGIGTLFVDHQLSITRFTPAITQVINLIQSDIGRPVRHFVSNLVGYSSLIDDVKAVLNDLIPREAEVQTNAGTWYLMRIRPYRTLDNVIEGAVITFVDITERRQAESTVRAQLAEIASYYDSAPIGLAVLDSELRIVRNNARMAEIYGFPPGEHVGKPIAAISRDLAEYAERIAAQVRSTGQAVIEQRVTGETDVEPGNRRIWQTGWYPLKVDGDAITGYSIIMYEAAERDLHKDGDT